MAALWLERRRAPVAAGLLLALPVFIKLTPLVFLVAWASRRAWRALVACVAALTALTALSLALSGAALNLAYLHRLGDIASHVLVAFDNQSLVAFLQRFQTDSHEVRHWHPFPLDGTARAVSLTTLGAGVATAVYVLPASLRRDAQGPALLDALLILVMLLAPVLSWTHYWVFLLPAAGIVLRAAPAGAQFPVRMVALLSVAFCCRPLLPDHLTAIIPRSGFVGGPTLGGVLLAITALWTAHVRATAPTVRE